MPDSYSQRALGIIFTLYNQQLEGCAYDARRVNLLSFENRGTLVRTGVKTSLQCRIRLVSCICDVHCRY